MSAPSQTRPAPSNEQLQQLFTQLPPATQEQIRALGQPQQQAYLLQLFQQRQQSPPTQGMQSAVPPPTSEQLQVIFTQLPAQTQEQIRALSPPQQQAYLLQVYQQQALSTQRSRTSGAPSASAPSNDQLQQLFTQLPAANQEQIRTLPAAQQQAYLLQVWNQQHPEQPTQSANTPPQPPQLPSNDQLQQIFTQLPPQTQEQIRALSPQQQQSYLAQIWQQQHPPNETSASRGSPAIQQRTSSPIQTAQQQQQQQKPIQPPTNEQLQTLFTQLPQPTQDQIRALTPQQQQAYLLQVYNQQQQQQITQRSGTDQSNAQQITATGSQVNSNPPTNEQLQQLFTQLPVQTQEQIRALPPAQQQSYLLQINHKEHHNLLHPEPNLQTGNNRPQVMSSSN
ncbi:MAG: hypothetical protein EZS28_013091 [Streblomastix strix]|uniref:Uncharacterized protein n=1 Tax=Streblomastix strix TaxID=222440 RepID=A0A5J4W8W7_9EUKA|nr:MAG: hypothetical protein EZS28_013091 [Streblomastix strix]